MVHELVLPDDDAAVIARFFFNEKKEKTTTDEDLAKLGWPGCVGRASSCSSTVLVNLTAMLAKLSKAKFTGLTGAGNVGANKEKEEEAFNEAKGVARQLVADKMVEDAKKASAASNEEFDAKVAASAATQEAADAASVVTANKQTPATLEEMMGDLDAAGDGEDYEADLDF